MHGGDGAADVFKHLNFNVVMAEHDALKLRERAALKRCRERRGALVSDSVRQELDDLKRRERASFQRSSKRLGALVSDDVPAEPDVLKFWERAAFKRASERSGSLVSDAVPAEPDVLKRRKRASLQRSSKRSGVLDSDAVPAEINASKRSILCIQAAQRIFKRARSGHSSGKCGGEQEREREREPCQWLTLRPCDLFLLELNSSVSRHHHESQHAVHRRTISVSPEKTLQSRSACAVQLRAQKRAHPDADVHDGDCAAYLFLHLVLDVVPVEIDAFKLRERAALQRCSERLGALDSDVVTTEPDELKRQERAALQRSSERLSALVSDVGPAEIDPFKCWERAALQRSSERLGALDYDVLASEMNALKRDIL